MAGSRPSGRSTAEPGDEVLRCDGDVVTAGLINTHHHLYQWATRGRAVGCNLFDWLVELYPVWGRLSVDEIHAAALARPHRAGPVGVHDRRRSPLPRAPGRRLGVRRHRRRRPSGGHPPGAVPRLDGPRARAQGGLPPDHVVEDRDAILASTESVIARLHDPDWCQVVVAPCSPFSVTPELMVESAELARRHGLRLHTHLCETVEETDYCLEHFGRRPGRPARRVGLGGRRRLAGPRHPHLRRRRSTASAPRARGWPTARPPTPASPRACVP